LNDIDRYTGLTEMGQTNVRVLCRLPVVTGLQRGQRAVYILTYSI